MHTRFQRLLVSLSLTLCLWGTCSYPQGQLHAQGLPLELKEFSEKHNPSLRSKRSAQQALRYQYQAIGMWPATTFEMALFTPEMEYPMGRQRYTLRAMQMIPPFKEFSLQRKDVAALQEMAQADYEMAKRSLWMSLQEYWIQWRSAEFQLRQLDQSLASMQEMQEWMRARNDARVGIEDQYDIDLEILGMQIEREKLLEKRNTLLAHLHQQMGDSIRSVNIPLEPLEPVSWMPDSLPAALAQHPELRMQQTSLQMEKIQEDMERVSGRPMVGLGLQYGRLNPIAAMSEGATMFMPMVQLNVPMSFSKRNAAVQRRRTQQEALEIERLEIQQKLEIRWRQARTEYRQAQRLSSLYQQQRELAYERYQLRLAGYRMGREEFDALLDRLRRYHDAAMKEIMALEEQHMILATLEELLGSTPPSTQE